MNIDELLNKKYLTAKELMLIMPIKYNQALKYIDEVQEEMKEKNFLIPLSKEKLALTKLVKKKFGL